MAHITYRVSGIPDEWSTQDLREELSNEYKVRVEILSFSKQPWQSGNANGVAIVAFRGIAENLESQISEWTPTITSYRTGNNGVVLTLDTHFSWFTPISDVDHDKEHIIDFVVVHGWGSHPYGGFVYKGEGARKSWLHRVAKDFPQLRIWFYGYQSHLMDKSRVTATDEWANNFRHSLRGLRPDDQKSRPMIILSHSLGGILVKKAIVLMRKNQDSRDLLNLMSIYGLLQFGVPSQGMNIDALVSMVKNKPSRYVLEQLNPEGGQSAREKEHREFCEAFSVSGSQIRYFYEAKRGPTVKWDKNQKRWNSSGKEKLAVSTNSACTLRYGENFDEVCISLDYNHSEMTKIRPGDEGTYRIIAYTIGDFAQKAPQTIQSRFWGSSPLKGLQGAHPSSQLEASGHQDYHECLNSLNYPDMNQRRRTLQAPYSNTCQWIMNNPKYQAWHSRLNGILWVRGKPGSGKSTVMSYIERNKDWKHPSENIVTAFHFLCGSGSSMQKTEIGLLRSLLFQILSAVPSQLAQLAKLYAKKKENSDTVEDLEWECYELKGFFQQMIHSPETPAIRLYIDALDEAEGDTAENIVEFYQNILQDPSSRLSVCFSCRYYPNFGLFDSGLDIQIEHENTRDINTYIEKALGSKIPQNAENKWIFDEISKRSSNIFQWVAIIIPKIVRLRRRGESPQTIWNCLEGVPSELNTIYGEILKGIVEEDRPESLKLFQWLCFSFRPLGLDELRYAMTIAFSEHYQPWENSHQFLDTHDNLRHRINYLSGGLAEISQICGPGTSQKHIGVQLIHQSVFDYSLSKGLTTLAYSKFSLERGHAFLADSCHIYITAMDANRISVLTSHYAHEGNNQYRCNHPKEEIASAVRETIYICQACSQLTPIDERKANVRREFPLMEYAVGNWIQHAMESEPLFDQSNLQNLLQGHNDIWKTLVLLNSLFNDSNIDLSNTFLHVAANIGWDNVFARKFALLARNETEFLFNLNSWNTMNRQGRTPIWIAASWGHLGILKTIPQKFRGICLNRSDGNRITPLLIALRRRHNGVAEFLLDDFTIDVNQQDYKGRNALMVCAERGDLTSLKRLLLRNDLTINLQDFKGKTALHRAVYYQHIEFVETLIQHSLSVNRFIQDHSGATPLHIAVEDNDFHMVELLLTYPERQELYQQKGETGLNYQDHDGDTALLKAMDPSRFDIAEILVDNGASCEIKNNNGRNAMDLAQHLGSKETIEMLGELGVKPSTSTLDGYTLLGSRMEGVEVTAK